MIWVINKIEPGDLKKNLLGWEWGDKEKRMKYHSLGLTEEVIFELKQEDNLFT